MIEWRQPLRAITMPPRHFRRRYNIFFRNVRKELKDKPDGETPSFGTLVQTVSKRWKELSVDDKKEHELLAKQDNERYYKEMKEYRQVRSGRVQRQAAALLRSHIRCFCRGILCLQCGMAAARRRANRPPK